MSIGGPVLEKSLQAATASQKPWLKVLIKIDNLYFREGRLTDAIRLAEEALGFALQVLAPGGAFLAKVFQGGSERSLLDVLKRDFTAVRHIKPKASRAGSPELYVLATGFRGKQANPSAED